MVVLHDTAVSADRYIDTGLLKVLIPLGRYVDHRRRLSPADALGFPRNADGAAADADLHEVGSCVCKEAEALAVHHIACTHLDRVAVPGADPLQAVLLPVGIALGGVHNQHIHAGFHQRGYPLLIVAGVDARTYHIALLAVQQFQRVALVGIIVLAEHKAHQPPLCGNDGQGVQLVIPDDIVSRFQAGSLRRGDNLLHRGHELRHAGGGIHTANPVVTAGDQAQQLPGAGAVLRDSHGGMAGFLLQGQHIRQRIRYPEVGIADHEPGFVILHLPNHGRLRLNGLGHIDKSDAALFSQRNAHLLAGHSLHHGGNHGYVHRQGTFLALFEPHHRRF